MAEDEDQKELDIMIGPPGIDEARDRFQRLGEEVKSKYTEVSEDVRRGAERASQEIRRGAYLYVRDNPGKALLIAAGVGLLLGLLARGRGGRRK